jgi:predicted kinase
MLTRAHLLCGKVGAGKTTTARQLEANRHGIVLSLDEWMLLLYEQPMSRELFDARLNRCTDLMVSIAERLVTAGTEPILDFGFWLRATRDAVRTRIRAAGGEPVLWYLDTPATVRWKRIESRNARLDSITHYIDREMFDTFESQFDEPGVDEHPIERPY